MGIRQDSGTILVIHSIARYAGDPLDPFETHHHKIGFIGNGGEGAPDPQPILIEEGDLGKWVTKQVDTSNILYNFCREEGNRYKVYVTPKATKKKTDGENPTLQDASAPLLCLVPTFLVPWLLEKNRTPIELLLKLRALYSTEEKFRPMWKTFSSLWSSSDIWRCKAPRQKLATSPPKSTQSSNQARPWDGG
jgi:hypothetical protein